MEVDKAILVDMGEDFGPSLYIYIYIYFFFFFNDFLGVFRVPFYWRFDDLVKRFIAIKYLHLLRLNNIIFFE